MAIVRFILVTIASVSGETLNLSNFVGETGPYYCVGCLMNLCERRKMLREHFKVGSGAFAAVVFFDRVVNLTKRNKIQCFFFIMKCPITWQGGSS